MYPRPPLSHNAVCGPLSSSCIRIADNQPQCTCERSRGKSAQPYRKGQPIREGVVSERTSPISAKRHKPEINIGHTCAGCQCRGRGEKFEQKRAKPDALLACNDSTAVPFQAASQPSFDRLRERAQVRPTRWRLPRSTDHLYAGNRSQNTVET